MNYFLIILNGVLISVMLAANGGLAAYYGVYFSGVVIQMVAVVLTSVIVIFRRESIVPVKGVPLYTYTGGIVFIIVTLISNFAFSSVSVSAILALQLLGSTVFSIFLDHYGLLGMKKQKVNGKKFIGIGFVIIGIFIMLNGSFNLKVILNIILITISGVGIVLSRVLCAKQATYTSPYYSSWYCNVIALLTTTVFCIASGSNFGLAAGVAGFPPMYLYLGAVLGVVIVVVNNIVVPRVPSFYMTLLTFSGQVFSGLLLDIILSGSFNPLNLYGGIFVTIGMVINSLLDKPKAVKDK